MNCNRCYQNPCACNTVPAPYYEDSCFQENQSQGVQVIHQYSPVLRISTEWAVPEATQTVTLKVAALSDMLTGIQIFNPTYGKFKVVEYDQEGQIIKVMKTTDNATPVGTVIPICTKFIIISGVSESNLSETVILPQVSKTAAQVEADYGTFATVGLIDDNKKLNSIRVFNDTDSNLEFSFNEGSDVAFIVPAFTTYDEVLNITFSSTDSLQMRKAAGETAGFGTVYIEGRYTS